MRLGELHLSLAELESDAAQPDESALQELDESIQRFGRLLLDGELGREAATLLRRAHQRKAELLDRLGRRDEADQAWKRVELVSGRAGQNRVLIERAHALARSGNHDTAAEILAPLEGREDLKGSDYYHVACVFSLASAAVPDDEALATESREVRSQAYAEQAMGMLRKAAAAGFFLRPVDVERLERDADLDPLRRREEFDEFIAALKLKAQSP
jgi:hypothetical protein